MKELYKKRKVFAAISAIGFISLTSLLSTYIITKDIISSVFVMTISWYVSTYAFMLILSRQGVFKEEIEEN